MKNQTILVTGGAGYIGAHVVRKLIEAECKVVVVDNLSTGLSAHVHSKAIFIEGNFANTMLLEKVFTDFKIDAVMHFAASIEVGESVQKPLEYLDNNTIGTNVLLQSMHKYGVKKLIFSSTAAVYGLQKQMPVKESAQLGPLDPYGYSKMLTEQLIQFYGAFTGMNAVIFRFFNACGSDFDKTIYSQHASHLIPTVIGATQGSIPEVIIFGDDYETPDGTGVRDYVHVLDIAQAHIKGMDYLEKQSGIEVINIGTGQGTSVKQVITEVERVSQKPVQVRVAARRPGDSPMTVADNTKLKEKLGYSLQYSDIYNIVETSFR